MAAGATPRTNEGQHERQDQCERELVRTNERGQRERVRTSRVGINKEWGDGYKRGQGHGWMTNTSRRMGGVNMNEGGQKVAEQGREREQQQQLPQQRRPLPPPFF